VAHEDALVTAASVIAGFDATAAALAAF